IWRRRSVAGFFHRAERADILRCDEDVTRTGIERGSTPICSAESAWEDQSRGRPTTLRAKSPRRKWPRVHNASDFFDKFLASLRVFGRGVCGRDDIVRFVADTGKRRRFQGNRLGWESHLTWSIASRYWALFNAEDRFAVLTIQDVHVAGLRGQRERRG